MINYLKKKKLRKRSGGVTQGIGPEFKTQYHTHQKKVHIFAASFLSLPLTGIRRNKGTDSLMFSALKLLLVMVILEQ
jgi:hypothetical protein